MATPSHDEIRELFPGLEGTIYLNTATVSAGCAPAVEAYRRAIDEWSRGRFDWTEAERAGEDARAIFAEIIGAEARDVAIVPAVSTGAGIVAASLPPARSGENVVVAGGEFSSNYYPWMLLRERGYDVREVADGGTRLIAVSAVHSATGYRADLAALSRVAARSGAWLFVDACQAAGAVPIDVVRDGVDFLACASHKFLLGARGMGYLYVRRELLDRIRPVVPGWKAARKPLESFYGPAMDLSPTASKLDASLTWFAALAERASLGIFRRFGVRALLERNAMLSRRMHDALAARLPSASLHAEPHRSTIVSVPVRDLDGVLARLRTANVVATARSGRVRLAAHFYNREEDLDRVAELVSES